MYIFNAKRCRFEIRLKILSFHIKFYCIHIGVAIFDLFFHAHVFSICFVVSHAGFSESLDFTSAQERPALLRKSTVHAQQLCQLVCGTRGH